MLTQAGDKRLGPHEETLEQRAGKTDLFRGTNVTSEERRQIKGKNMENKRCVDKKRKWKEQTDGPGILNKPNEVIMSRGLILQALGGAAEAAVKRDMFIISSLLLMLIRGSASVPARGPEPNKVGVKQEEQ